MEKDENVIAHDKRRLQVYADDEDVLVKVLEIPEADYECVLVNGPWPEKSLLEGDIVLCAGNRTALAGDIVLCAGNRTALAGDIVLIEQGGRERLGVLAEPGFLETKYGRRPLDSSEIIIGVGVALARKLAGGSIDFAL